MVVFLGIVVRIQTLDRRAFNEDRKEIPSMPPPTPMRKEVSRRIRTFMEIQETNQVDAIDDDQDRRPGRIAPTILVLWTAPHSSPRQPIQKPILGTTVPTSHSGRHRRSGKTPPALLLLLHRRSGHESGSRRRHASGHPRTPRQTALKPFPLRPLLRRFLPSPRLTDQWKVALETRYGFQKRVPGWIVPLLVPFVVALR